MHYLFSSYPVIMNSPNNFRECKVLCWNVRGINSDKKWDSIIDKISESRFDVVCLQETKKESFDLAFIKKFCPPSFDEFLYLQSNGTSGGIIITIWESALLEGHLASQNEFVTSEEFTSKYNNSEWILTNIYGPCTT